MYGREYLNFDYKMKEHGVKEIRSFPIYLDVHYFNLTHDPISIDMENFSFNFTRMVVDDEAVLAMKIPLIEEWNITFTYKYKALGFIPCEGTIKVGFRNVGAEATLKLLATQHGHLHPELHDLVLDFGQT